MKLVIKDGKDKNNGAAACVGSSLTDPDRAKSFAFCSQIVTELNIVTFLVVCKVKMTRML